MSVFSRVEDWMGDSALRFFLAIGIAVAVISVGVVGVLQLAGVDTKHYCKPGTHLFMQPAGKGILIPLCEPN
jgi:hypothetical protein